MENTEPIKVYLAGGMRSGWQETVKDSCPLLLFADPRGKNPERTWSVYQYSSWDLTAIKASDLIFAYMEKTNPSGIGLACELGYGYALRKTVILVLETENEHQKDRYLQWMKKVAHVVFDNFNEGIEYLQKYQEMYK